MSDDKCMGDKPWRDKPDKKKSTADHDVYICTCPGKHMKVSKKHQANPWVYGGPWG